jgi:UDP-3-O-[3-hydroxymyristoyl] N-acetylglucosamine deacetylase
MLIERGMQKTVDRIEQASGIGLFTGKKVSIRILAAPVDSGIVFSRVDLPGQPEVPAQLSYVASTDRCTCLRNGPAAVFMVEHILSALSGLGVDNARIEVEGPEIPAGDGSANLFVQLLQQAGIVEQTKPARRCCISQTVSWSKGEICLVALPSDEMRVSYVLHFPQSSLIGSQYFSYLVEGDSYQSAIAPSRTFSLYEEIAPYIEKGLIQGGGLENALVIRDNRIMNPEGARFADEMVRHKILDLIGDLALLGEKVNAHIIAIRSGHYSNIEFAKILSAQADWALSI